MIAYCSLSTNRTTRAELAKYGWRWIVGPFAPKGWRKTMGSDQYALDNGAWSCHQKGIPFDSDRFRKAVDTHGENADWVVLPDCVGDMDATLEMAESWYGKLHGLRLMLAVQDGMDESHALPFIGRGCGIFIGGSTDWKLDTIHMWAGLGARHGAWVHCGRVNTVRRLKMCKWAGVRSFDGSGVSVWAKHAARINRHLRASDLQVPLFDRYGQNCFDLGGKE